jgi:DNA repair protein RadC
MNNIESLRKLSDKDLLAVLVGQAEAAKCQEPLSLLFGMRPRHQVSAVREKEAIYAPTKANKCSKTIMAAKELVMRALSQEVAHKPIQLNSPQAVKDVLKLLLGGRQQEVFVVMFLDAQHQLIATEEMFSGTLTQTSVYPREVVKRALFHNSAAVIFSHNHPSGIAESSQSDRMLTDALKQALSLVDVRVIDHFIVGNDEVMSFAERGMI